MKNVAIYRWLCPQWKYNLIFIYFIPTTFYVWITKDIELMVNKLLNSKNYSYHDATKATTNILITELKSMTE